MNYQEALAALRNGKTLMAVEQTRDGKTTKGWKIGTVKIPNSVAIRLRPMCHFHNHRIHDGKYVKSQYTGYRWKGKIARVVKDGMKSKPTVEKSKVMTRREAILKMELGEKLIRTPVKPGSIRGVYTLGGVAIDGVTANEVIISLKGTSRFWQEGDDTEMVYYLAKNPR